MTQAHGADSTEGGKLGLLCHPVAFFAYLLAGVALAFAFGSGSGHFGLDLFQLLVVWFAIVAWFFAILARWGSAEDEVDGEVVRKPNRLQRRAIWMVLVLALVFSALQNYAVYRALVDRLDQLHSDTVNATQDIDTRLLDTRLHAQQLSDDFDAWNSAPDAQRSIAHARVSADIADLRQRTHDIDTHLQAVVKRLTPSATGDPNATPTLAQSTLASARNLADDAEQDSAQMLRVLDIVDVAWQSNPSAFDATDQLRLMINPNLWMSIDNVNGSTARLSAALSAAATIPFADLFVATVALNLTAVLFPWLLLLLFVTARRDVRIRQIYQDLWTLGGGDVNAGEARSLLTRVLDSVSNEAKFTATGYRDAEVRRALEDRTFSNVEFLLSLGALTFIVTAGWHLLLYPTGTLGFAELVANGVSVRDFALFVTGNLNVITLGFLGAYFYGVGTLIRRFYASDLYPAAFLQMLVRLITTLVISLVLTILVPILAASAPNAAHLTDPLPGLPSPTIGGTPINGATAIAGAMAFVFGIWTRSFLGWLPRLMASLPIGVGDLDDAQASVAVLEGVDVWVEGRLSEEGIETVQAMATTSIERLVRRTYFSTTQIVSWVDQALLYMHAGSSGEWMNEFRTASVHKASDLIDAVGFSYELNPGKLPAPISPANIAEAVHDISIASGGKLSESVIYEVCNTLWSEPNLRYVLNFHRANRVVVHRPPFLPPRGTAALELPPKVDTLHTNGSANGVSNGVAGSEASAAVSRRAADDQQDATPG